MTWGTQVKTTHSRQATKFSQCDSPPPRRVIETRRKVRVTLELDVEDIDYSEQLAPAVTDAEGQHPPVTRRDVLQSDIYTICQEALAEHDIDIHGLSLRMQNVQEYVAFTPAPEESAP